MYVDNRKFYKSNALLNPAECNLAGTYDLSPRNCNCPVGHMLHYCRYVFGKTFENERITQ